MGDVYRANICTVYDIGEQAAAGATWCRKPPAARWIPAKRPPSLPVGPHPPGALDLTSPGSTLGTVA
jgi:hypothetical protein